MEVETIIKFFIILLTALYLCFIIYKKFPSREKKTFKTSVIKSTPFIKYINPFNVRIQHIENNLVIHLTNQVKCFLGIYWNVNIHKFLEIVHKPWHQISTFNMLHQQTNESCNLSQFFLINEANRNKTFKFYIPRLEESTSHQNTKYLSTYPAVIITMLTDEDTDTRNICLLITAVHISCDKIPLQTTKIFQIVRRPNSLPFYLKKMYISQDPKNEDKDENVINADSCLDLKLNQSTDIVDTEKSKNNSSKSCALDKDIIIADHSAHNNTQPTILKCKNSDCTKMHSEVLNNCTEESELPENISKEHSADLHVDDKFKKVKATFSNCCIVNRTELLTNPDDENTIHFNSSRLRNRKHIIASKISNMLKTKAGPTNLSRLINKNNFDYLENALITNSKLKNESINKESLWKHTTSEDKCINNEDQKLDSDNIIQINSCRRIDEILNSNTSNKEVVAPLCTVCLIQNITSIALPCRHVYTCDFCFKKLTHCPLCRSLVLYTVPIIFS